MAKSDADQYAHYPSSRPTRLPGAQDRVKEIVTSHALDNEDVVVEVPLWVLRGLCKQ